MFQVFTIQVLFIKSIQLLQNITLYTKIFFKFIIQVLYKISTKSKDNFVCYFFWCNNAWQ